MSKYNAEYFINKFSKIPNSSWTDNGEYSNQDGSKCALGLCGANYTSNTKEGTALHLLFIRKLGAYVSNINDGGPPCGMIYNNFCVPKEKALLLGKTPKQRVLTALELIAAGISI